MAILSKIKSKVKQVASNIKAGLGVVKDAAKSVYATITSGGGFGGAAAAALSSVKSSTSTKQPSLVYTPASYPPSASNPKPSSGSVAVGPVAAPRTVTSVSTKSNYSNPSYSTDTIYNAPTGFSALSAPREVRVTADTANIGGVAVPTASAPGIPDYQSLAGISPVTETPTGTVTTAQPELTPEQKIAEATTNYIESRKKPPKTEDLYQKAQEESGLIEAQNRKNEIQNRINARTTQMNQAILAEEGRGEGAVLDVIGGRQAKIKREAAIDLLPLNAELAVAQGDLELASERLNTLFKIYTTDAENSVNFYNDTKKLYYEYMTESEKRKADAISKDKTDALSQLKDITNFQQQVWLKAMGDGNTALMSALKQVKPPVNTNSPSFRTDLANYMADIQAVAGRYAGSGVTSSSDAPLYSGLNSATATAVRGIVSGFKSEPIVTNFTQVQEGNNFAQSISNTTTNPADDQALIYSLAKALDPGSVVREGEYATAQKYSQSWVAAYGKSITQALNGTGFLSEQARKNIKSTIKTKYQSSLNSYNNLQSQYANQINSLTGRNNGSEFLRDYRVNAPAQQTVSQTQSDIFDSVVGNSSGGYWSNLWSALTGK